MRPSCSRLSTGRAVFLGLVASTALWLFAFTPTTLRFHWSKFLIDYNAGTNQEHSWPSDENTKFILFATSFFGSSNMGFGDGQKAFVDHGCEVTNCVATDDVNAVDDFSRFDAVVFHLENMNSRFSVTREFYDQKRIADQRFVCFILESPEMLKFNRFEEFSDFFNWTMTYRASSEILAPYGAVIPNGPALSREEISKAMRDFRPSESLKSVLDRPKSILWFVSHCYTHSEREKYAWELQKYVEVDIFGECSGDRNCRRHSSCDMNLAKEYKFYLSFENSMCSDYITEKLFRHLAHNTIPIVLGGANYSRVLPPHSYIDTQDFASPRDLAQYLTRLLENPDEFLSYFWWEQHYTLIPNGRWHHSFCTLCEKLHNSPPHSPSVISNLRDVLFFKPSHEGGGPQCQTKGTYPWSHFVNPSTDQGEWSRPSHWIILGIIALTGILLVILLCLAKLAYKSCKRSRSEAQI